MLGRRYKDSDRFLLSCAKTPIALKIDMLLFVVRSFIYIEIWVERKGVVVFEFLECSDTMLDGVNVSRRGDGLDSDSS